MRCKDRALYPSNNTKLPISIIDGAYYQMVVYEQSAGVFSLYAVMVRSTVNKVFGGDADRYCRFFDVDCTPVFSSIAESERSTKKNAPSGAK